MFVEVWRQSSPSISPEGRDEKYSARPALRRANVTQTERRHGDCRGVARPGHRREHRALQHRGCDVAEAAAGQGTAAAGVIPITGCEKLQLRWLFRRHQSRSYDWLATWDFIPVCQLSTDARTAE